MNSGYFFAELKRRNVYKVAVAYAVVGWLLVQVATQVFPFFEIPNWAVRLCFDRPSRAIRILLWPMRTFQLLRPKSSTRASLTAQTSLRTQELMRTRRKFMPTGTDP